MAALRVLGLVLAMIIQSTLEAGVPAGSPDDTRSSNDLQAGERKPEQQCQSRFTYEFVANNGRTVDDSRLTDEHGNRIRHGMEHCSLNHCDWAGNLGKHCPRGRGQVESVQVYGQGVGNIELDRGDQKGMKSIWTSSSDQLFNTGEMKEYNFVSSWVEMTFNARFNDYQFRMRMPVCCLN
jgi:hypothetical protein